MSIIYLAEIPREKFKNTYGPPQITTVVWNEKGYAVSAFKLRGPK